MQKNRLFGGILTLAVPGAVALGTDASGIVATIMTGFFYIGGAVMVWDGLDRD